MGDRLSRTELITQARRLACQHIENAVIPAECILRAVRIEATEIAIKSLAGDLLHHANVDLLTEES